MENLCSVSISVLHFSTVGIIPCTIKLVKEKTQKCALNVEGIQFFCTDKNIFTMFCNKLSSV